MSASFPAYTLLSLGDIAAPLVLDSPHSGSGYPDDMPIACALHDLRQTEDAHVDVLFENAADHGIPLLKAHIARGIIDMNRAIDDIEPNILDAPYPEPLAPSDRSLVGHGLIRHFCRNLPVYAEKIPVKVAQERIRRYYKPYHAALKALLDHAHGRFGAVWHINCHSMASSDVQGLARISENFARPRPDFILGDRDCTTCEPAFMDITAQFLRAKGYRVAYNDPYKGMEILRRYGHPHAGFHSLQLEINRALYMNEETLERSTNFQRLQDDLTALVAHLKAWILQRVDQGKMAAE